MNLSTARHRGREIFAASGAPAAILFYSRAVGCQFVPKYTAAIADGSKKF